MTARERLLGELNNRALSTVDAEQLAAIAAVVNKERAMTMSEKIGELAAALAKAQGQMTHAAKDNTNPHFKSNYADLASVIDACRGPLAANGLSVSQLPTFGERGVVLTTMLMHSSGEWLSSQLEVPVSKHDAQGVGSALTYARRYALSAMVGVAQDDDDGNAAAKNPGCNRLDDNRPADRKPLRPASEGMAADAANVERDEPRPVEETISAEKGKSITAKLLELKRAVDSCTTAKMLTATMESWGDTLAKMSAGARKIADGYVGGRHSTIMGEEMSNADAATTTKLNEMAKE